MRYSFPIFPYGEWLLEQAIKGGYKPLTKKGKEIKSAMDKEHGGNKGKKK
jgi:hypothetical protein